MSELDYSRHYLRFHDASDDHFRIHGDAAYAELKSYLPADRDAPILEIGCGMGFALGGLLAAGYRNVTGIDSSSHQVAASQQRSLPAELVPVSETLRFLAERRGHYQVVYAIDVLEHIPPDALIEVLVAIREALVPGGLFVCRVPNANSVLGMRMRYVDWTHVVSFTEVSLDFVLFQAQFKDVEVRETTELMPGSPAGFKARMIKKLFRGLHRLYLQAEHGKAFAGTVPLTPNILASARA